MNIPVPETNKDTERVTLSRVANPNNSSSFEEKLVIVAPKRDFIVYLEEREIIQPVQESSEPCQQVQNL